MQHAAAVVAVDERHRLAGEDVARMDDPQSREDHPRVAVGVAGAEVIELDLVGAAADGHLVLERPLRHAAVVVLLEDVHLLHVGLGVLLDDDVDRRREIHVAAHMVAVCVCVDERCHRLGRQLLDLVEDRLAPARVLRVDDDDAVCSEEHGGVAAAAAQHVQVVLDLLDIDHLRRVRRGRLRLHRR